MKISLVFFSLFLNVGLILAQFDQGGNLHGEQMEMFVAPHNGHLEDFGRYKVELTTDILRKENQLTFYLYKGEMKPLSIEEVKGKMTLLYEDGTTEISELLAVGNEFFLGTINSAKSYLCTVEFTIKKTVISTAYTHKAIGDTKYTCVKHPKLKVSSPGCCENCGMELIPIKEKTIEINNQ